MMITKSVCKTVFVEEALDPGIADALFVVLKDEIPWEDGIKSKKGNTRKAYACNMGDFEEVDMAITQCLDKIAKIDYAILGVYLNYYRDGNDWTPNHNHPGSHQLVISLGATRQLDVAKKSYQMTSGSAIIFGSAQHGVPKIPDFAGERISIATFMVPITSAPVQEGEK